MVCLDAGGGDFERLWLTAGLRGAVQATVTISILESSVQSGIAGGIIPSSFRIMRRLLDRLEDAATGELLLPELNATGQERFPTATSSQAAQGTVKFGLTPGTSRRGS